MERITLGSTVTVRRGERTFTGKLVRVYGGRMAVGDLDRAYVLETPDGDHVYCGPDPEQTIEPAEG